MYKQKGGIMTSVTVADFWQTISLLKKQTQKIKDPTKAVIWEADE